MGRQEDRRRRKALGLNKKNIPSVPFTASDGTTIFPIHTDNGALSNLGLIESRDLKNVMGTLSDNEMNRLIYQHAQLAVENGYNAPWPEDDFGSVMWFLWTFITPEMRETFPEIAREYLANEPMVGEQFSDIPYPRMNESTWQDAFNFRVLAIMLFAARRGSTYSSNFLISLYKVYYRREFNRVKKLRKLTLFDLFEMHDEDCKRKGYPAGHATSGQKTYGQHVIETRMHQAGWTNASGKRRLTTEPQSEIADEDIHDAVSYMKEIANMPQEPAMAPTASRLFIMCELMGVPIDPTCNKLAQDNNESQGSLAQLITPAIKHCHRGHWYHQVLDKVRESGDQSMTGRASGFVTVMS